MTRRSIPTMVLCVVAVVTAWPIASQAGVLTGSLAGGPAIHRNLTADGNEDWGIWGFAQDGTSTSLTPDDRKAGGSGISALTDISNGTPLAPCSASSGFSCCGGVRGR